MAVSLRVESRQWVKWRVWCEQRFEMFSFFCFFQISFYCAGLLSRQLGKRNSFHSLHANGSRCDVDHMIITANPVFAIFHPFHFSVSRCDRCINLLLQMTCRPYDRHLNSNKVAIVIVFFFLARPYRANRTVLVANVERKARPVFVYVLRS